MKIVSYKGINIVQADFKLPVNDEEYYISNLKTYTDLVAKDDTKYIYFAKQDSRGRLSITQENSKYCVSVNQIFFSSGKELLSYIVGYVDCHRANKQIWTKSK